MNTKINDIVEHYLHILARPDKEYSYTEEYLSLLKEHIFFTEKFHQKIQSGIKDLYLVYTDHDYTLANSPAIKEDEYISYVQNYGAPIWDLEFAAVLCFNKSDLNFLKLVTENPKNLDIKNLKTMLKKIYEVADI